MDILSVANDQLQHQLAEAQRQQSVVENFQSVLEKAGGARADGLSEQQDQELREACESFESYFLQMMFREMRKTSFDENGFIQKSQAEEMFTDMMDEESSKSAAKLGGIGLADMMYKQMTVVNRYSAAAE